MVTTCNFLIPIYNHKLTVVIFDDYKEVKDKYSQLNWETALGGAIQYHNKDIVLIPKDDLVTAIHEAEHVKNNVWRQIGYTPQIENDEPDAYLIDYIYDKMLKTINKHKLASKC